jgi:hypothetical protein
MSAIFESETLGPTERLIMLALADHANDEGRCYPSIARLCQRTGLSERAIQANVKRLTEAGHIKLAPGGGRAQTNLYLISANPAADAPRSRCTPAADAPQTPQQVRQTPQQVRQNPAADAPEPSITIKEPSERVIAREPVRFVPKAAPDGFSEFWARYPRKVAKGAAQKAYAKAMKAARHDDVMFALSQQLPALEAKDQQYIPHPATWLNAERWNDEPEHVADNASRVTPHRSRHRPDPATEQILRLAGLGAASGYGRP